MEIVEQLGNFKEFQNRYHFVLWDTFYKHVEIFWPCDVNKIGISSVFSAAEILRNIIWEKWGLLLSFEINNSGVYWEIVDSTKHDCTTFYKEFESTGGDAIKEVLVDSFSGVIDWYLNKLFNLQRYGK